MIKRNLTRRLEELEARLAPPAEPLVVQIVYVTPDGQAEPDGPPIVTPMTVDRYRPWQRKKQ